MTYLPSNYINANYSYIVSSNSYQIRTNNNCYTQYTTTYCDCYDVYFNNDYLVSSPYACSVSNSSHTIDYTNFSDNFYYRLDFDKILIIFFIIVVLCYFLAFKPISRAFGRWLKL